jgi:hypothetical protein
MKYFKGIKTSLINILLEEQGNEEYYDLYLWKDGELSDITKANFIDKDGYVDVAILHNQIKTEVKKGNYEFIELVYGNKEMDTRDFFSFKGFNFNNSFEASNK